MREAERSSLLFINPRGNAPHPTMHTHSAPEKGVAVRGSAAQTYAGSLCGPGWTDVGVVGGLNRCPAARALCCGEAGPRHCPLGEGVGTSWKPLSAVSTRGPQEPSPRALRPVPRFGRIFRTPAGSRK